MEVKEDKSKEKCATHKYPDFAGVEPLILRHFLSNCNFSCYLGTVQIGSSNLVLVLNTGFNRIVGIITVSEACTLVKGDETHLNEFPLTLSSSVYRISKECF